MEGINRLIEEAIAAGVMPGANYCLIIDQHIQFGSLGKRAIYPVEEDNNLDTIYDMASLTKVVATTTAIMLLLEQGKLRLFDSVAHFLPRFIHKNITIWDLLTHTAGLAPFIPSTAYTGKEDLIEKIYNIELRAEKNAKIIYSDLGFILLGWVVEAISKMSLADFTKKMIFDVLEMKDSGYRPKDTMRCAPTEDRGDHIDRGYVHDERAFDLDQVAGHAGLFSTVGDIAHFMEMYLNRGKYKGKQFLSEQTIDLLFQVQVVEEKGVALSRNQRGLGWIVKGDYPCAGDLVSAETIMHTGFTGTHIFIDRKNKVAFCMLTNRVHPTRDNIDIIAFRARLGNYIMSHLEGGF